MEQHVLPAAQRLATALQQWHGLEGKNVSVFDREFIVRAVGKYAPDAGYRLLNELKKCVLPPMPLAMRDPTTMENFVDAGRDLCLSAFFFNAAHAYTASELDRLTQVHAEFEFDGLRPGQAGIYQVHRGLGPG